MTQSNRLIYNSDIYVWISIYICENDIKLTRSNQKETIEGLFNDKLFVILILRLQRKIVYEEKYKNVS